MYHSFSIDTRIIAEVRQDRNNKLLYTFYPVFSIEIKSKTHRAKVQIQIKVWAMVKINNLIQQLSANKSPKEISMKPRRRTSPRIVRLTLVTLILRVVVH
jgi:hypothetical protein|tara:strand:- start:1541 stop:1840 length:300 start_codon:yes stop_codon:yes gene_type:complete